MTTSTGDKEKGDFKTLIHRTSIKLNWSSGWNSIENKIGWSNIQVNGVTLAIWCQPCCWFIWTTKESFDVPIWAIHFVNFSHKHFTTFSKYLSWEFPLQSPPHFFRQKSSGNTLQYLSLKTWINHNLISHWNLSTPMCPLWGLWAIPLLHSYFFLAHTLHQNPIWLPHNHTSDI